MTLLKHSVTSSPVKSSRSSDGTRRVVVEGGRTDGVRRLTLSPKRDALPKEKPEIRATVTVCTTAIPTVEDERIAPSLDEALNALVGGKEVLLSKHSYKLVRKGQILDDSVCLYTGIYVRSLNSNSYSYSQFQVGVLVDFIERNLYSCEIVS